MTLYCNNRKWKEEMKMRNEWMRWHPLKIVVLITTTLWWRWVVSVSIVCHTDFAHTHVRFQLSSSIVPYRILTAIELRVHDESHLAIALFLWSSWYCVTLLHTYIFSKFHVIFMLIVSIILYYILCTYMQHVIYILHLIWIFYFF